MKQLFFGLLMLLAFSSAAYAGNTSNTIDNATDADVVQEFADMRPNAGNMTDAIHTTPGNTLPDCTKTNTFKAADPALQGKTLDHAPTKALNGDCIHVQMNADGGIGIIDCIDMGRVASAFGVSVPVFAEAYSDGIVEQILNEGGMRVYLTYNGQTADFPICN